MSALNEIRNVLSHRAGAFLSNEISLAQEIYDALDVAGYLVEPNGPIYIEVNGRAVTHTTELADGITVSWNNDTVVGFEIRDGFSAVSL